MDRNITDHEAFDRWFEENGYDPEHYVIFEIVWDAAIYWKVGFDVTCNASDKP